MLQGARAIHHVINLFIGTFHSFKKHLSTLSEQACNKMDNLQAKHFIIMLLGSTQCTSFNSQRWHERLIFHNRNVIPSWCYHTKVIFFFILCDNETAERCQSRVWTFLTKQLSTAAAQTKSIRFTSKLENDIKSSSEKRSALHHTYKQQQSFSWKKKM